MRWPGAAPSRCCSRATISSTRMSNRRFPEQSLAAPAKILVIKLSALGDIVQAMAPAAAIRAQHPQAEIVFLTTAPYAALARQAPYFDAVWIDERPRGAAGLLRLRRRLRAAGFDRVYDLQTRPRTAVYFWLMRSRGRPEW